MAVTWQINGTTLAALGVSSASLRTVSLAPDVLTWTVPVADCAATVAGWVWDEEVVLTRTEGGEAVVWFRGRVVGVERVAGGASHAHRYTAHGPWALLAETPFLQLYQEAEDPDDEEPELIERLRGRVILGQDGEGDPVPIDAAVEAILEYAATECDLAVAAGTITAPLTVPWDEATDLTCADAILRLTGWLPDAVAWWDYTVTPPALHLQRRGALEAATLALGEPGWVPGSAVAETAGVVPLASVALTERRDLQVPGVLLIYLRDHAANGSTWQTTVRDAWPAEFAGQTRRALVRTIQLAGSQFSSTVLTQDVETRDLPAQLDSYNTETWLTTGGDFTALRDWWLQQAPQLRSPKITLKGIRRVQRLDESTGGAADTSLGRELVDGAITDWMIDPQGVEQQAQRVRAEIAYETDLGGGKKGRSVDVVEVIVVATDATTRTYSYTAAAESTEEEATPTGLAAALYAGLNAVQWDGRLEVVEQEASALVRVGHKLRVTGGLAAWATMDALVQQVGVDLLGGRTEVVVGPAKHLGPDDLVEIWRSNRTRRPVTSHLLRATGNAGSAGGAQGLGKVLPGKPSGSTRRPPERFAVAITPAGIFPTVAELQSGAAAQYSATKLPVEGDVMIFTVGAAPKWRMVVSATPTGLSNLTAFDITVSSVSYGLTGSQMGLY